MWSPYGAFNACDPQVGYTLAVMGYNDPDNSWSNSFDQYMMASTACFWDGGGGGGGGGGGASAPDCNGITTAVGFAGLTYANASEMWNDGGLSTYSDDATAATIGALAAVTWQGESGFLLNPTQNPNYNTKGVVTSVDYGPFQINQGFHPNSNDAVWGTNGACQVFNGNADANIRFGISILEQLYGSFGNNAAGQYVGSLDIDNIDKKTGKPTLGQKRENAWCTGCRRAGLRNGRCMEFRARIWGPITCLRH
ncbi:MAG: hypothetical protein ABJA67_13775 [Chthonomonadales bacterium]